MDDARGTADLNYSANKSMGKLGARGIRLNSNLRDVDHDTAEVLDGTFGEMDHVGFDWWRNPLNSANWGIPNVADAGKDLADDKIEE